MSDDHAAHLVSAIVIMTDNAIGDISNALQAGDPDAARKHLQSAVEQLRGLQSAAIEVQKMQDETRGLPDA